MMRGSPLCFMADVYCGIGRPYAERRDPSQRVSLAGDSAWQPPI